MFRTCRPPYAVFMDSLEQLDQEDATVKAGILRQKRNEVIDYHIAKANRIFTRSWICWTKPHHYILIP